MPFFEIFASPRFFLFSFFFLPLLPPASIIVCTLQSFPQVFKENASCCCLWSGTSQPKTCEILSTCSWSWPRDNLTWWNFLSSYKSKAVLLSPLFLRDHTALFYVQFYSLLPTLSINALMRVCLSSRFLAGPSFQWSCQRTWVLLCWHRSYWWHAFVSQYKPEGVCCFYFLTMKKHVLHCFSTYPTEGDSSEQCPPTLVLTVCRWLGVPCSGVAI